MRARGSVYVLTTTVSPDLCRISFSAKSPELRVKEMLRKRPEQRFIIEYAVVVDNPHRYCDVARKKLTEQGKHEWKEWFRCTPEEAAVVIRDAIGRARIYSETVRGEERLQKDLESEKKIAPASVPGRGPDQKQPTSAIVQPLQDGSELRRKGEEAVRRETLGATAEKKAAPEPLADAATPGGSLAVSGVMERPSAPSETEKQAEIPAVVESPEIQTFLLKEQEDALRREKEEVRLALEERRKGAVGERGEAKKRRYWIPGRATEEEGSRFWEIAVTLLADVGCLYLVFASKGIFITVVGLVLVAFFTILLVDSFRTLRGRRKRSLEKDP